MLKMLDFVSSPLTRTDAPRASARALARSAVFLSASACAFLLTFSCATLFMTLTPSEAMAQDEEEARNVIIMPVPYGGTKMLAKKIYALENVNPYPKKWFNEKVESRGFEPDGILSNKKDLRWVMDRTNIALIIDFFYDEETALYTVYFYSPRTGEIAKEFEVSSDEDGLTEDGADKITEEAQAFINGGDPSSDKDPDEKDPDEKDPDGTGDGELTADELRKKAIEDQDKKKSELPTDFLMAGAMVRLTKHDLLIGGSNGAVTNYTSTFYPGYDVNFEAFPLVFAGSDVTAIGLYAHFQQGFDSVAIQDPTTLQATTLRVRQLQVDGGLSYRLDTPRKMDSTESFIRARLRAGVRHIRNTIDENTVIPSTSLTALVIGGHVGYPVFGAFSLQGGVEFIPFGAWGLSEAQFGEDSFTYGMGSHIGGTYMFTDNLGFSFSYDFNLYRTLFQGVGTANFEAANAFDFYQGINAGLHIQY